MPDLKYANGLPVGQNGEFILDANGNEVAVGLNNAQPVASEPKAANQTNKKATGSFTTSTTVNTIQNWYTVTAGKTLYITDLSFSSNSTTPVSVTINASSTFGQGAVHTDFITSTPDNATNLRSPLDIPGGSPITIQAPTTASAITIDFNIEGYEQ